MLKIEKLELNHRSLLEERLKKLDTATSNIQIESGVGINLSEYTFANLYLFRKLHEYELLFDKDIFVKGKTRDGQAFLMPTSHPQEWSADIFNFVFNQPDCLYPIPSAWLTYFEKFAKSFSFNEADSDYLFETDKIALYPGRKLSKKRGLVKQLFERHQVESLAYSRAYKKEALEIVDIWQRETLADKTQADYESAVEAIGLFDELGLTGRIFKVDGIPKGILIGERLNDNCFALHFGKASRELHGLNQFMFQDFAKSLDGKYRFLNFEQDLGLPNLRKAKHSYHPDQMLKKYRIYF